MNKNVTDLTEFRKFALLLIYFKITENIRLQLDKFIISVILFRKELLRWELSLLMTRKIWF